MVIMESGQSVMEGISGAPGICIGKAYIVDSEGVNLIKRYRLSDDMVESEVDRFKQAVTQAKNDHAKVIESLDSDLNDHLNILEAHMILFEDKMLYKQTIDTIEREKINAEWALRRISRKVRAMFRKIDDTYLQARVNDIGQVSDKIMACLVGASDIRIADISKRVVLVAHDLSPADASQIQLERIKGFVTDRGGKDSHTSIVAKSLGIPAVLGLGDATAVVKNDDLLIVDGLRGTLIINPDEETLFKYEDRLMRLQEYHAGLARESHLPAITLDGTKIDLMANIELVEEVVGARDFGAEEIGLFRTEFLYLDLKRFPTEDELLSKYKELVEVMAPRGVTMRTLDINGDKVNPYLSSFQEENPALGQRAVRFCLENQNVFITQIKAILRAAAFGDIKLLIPMISCVEEIIQVKEVINKAVLELELEEKIFNKDIPLGAMIEVPSAVMLAEHIADHVDFFSIGTNDLIQYSMAIDRRNRKVAHLYQPLNPAVLKMIRHTCDVAAKKNIDLVMCGEMAGEALNIPVLVGIGLTQFSMNSVSIPVIKQIIRNLDVEKARKAAEKVLQMTTAKEITDYITKEFKDIMQFRLPGGRAS